MSQYVQSERNLQIEGTLFSRYLIGRKASADLIQRYAAACSIRLPDAAERPGAASTELAIRHPFLLPALDAVSAFLRPKSVLREKLLIMAAVLETSPTHASDFLPEHCSLGRMVFRGLGCGLRTTGRLLIGMAILFVRRGRL